MLLFFPCPCSLSSRDSLICSNPLSRLILSLVPILFGPGSLQSHFSLSHYLSSFITLQHQSTVCSPPVISSPNFLQPEFSLTPIDSCPSSLALFSLTPVVSGSQVSQVLILSPNSLQPEFSLALRFSLALVMFQFSVISGSTSLRPHSKWPQFSLSSNNSLILVPIFILSLACMSLLATFFCDPNSVCHLILAVLQDQQCSPSSLASLLPFPRASTPRSNDKVPHHGERGEEGEMRKERQEKRTRFVFVAFCFVFDGPQGRRSLSQRGGHRSSVVHALRQPSGRARLGNHRSRRATFQSRQARSLLAKSKVVTKDTKMGRFKAALSARRPGVDSKVRPPRTAEGQDGCKSRATPPGPRCTGRRSYQPPPTRIGVGRRQPKCRTIEGGFEEGLGAVPCPGAKGRVSRAEARIREAKTPSLWQKHNCSRRSKISWN